LKHAQRTPAVPYAYLEAFASKAIQIYENFCSEAQEASGQPDGVDAQPHVRAFLMNFKWLLANLKKCRRFSLLIQTLTHQLFRLSPKYERPKSASMSIDAKSSPSGFAGGI